MRGNRRAERPATKAGPGAATGHPPGDGGAGGVAATPGAGGSGALTAANLRAFLLKFVPGTEHEARPHGVPTGYDWYAASSQPALTPPNEETLTNWWGQVYVDETGVIAPNVRVAVANITYLALYDDSDDWVVIQDDPLMGGGTWAEDFHSNCDASAYDVRQEQDGGFSWTTASGCNAHYWPNGGQSDIDEAKLRAAVVVGFTRLALDDQHGADNRAESAYINGLGADWRVEGGGCPTPPESDVMVCSGVGGGKFIRVGSEWRTMLFQSMSAAELDTFPLPPLEYFEQPDGQYFR